MQSPPLRAIAAGAAAIVAADLASKWLAVAMAPAARPAWIEPALNPELSLGVVGGSLPLLVATMAVAIVAGAALCVRGLRRGLAPWVPATLLGGMLANTFDRIMSGAVHDFIVAPVIVLNLADIAVFAALAALIRHELVLVPTSRKEVTS